MTRTPNISFRDARVRMAQELADLMMLACPDLEPTSAIREAAAQAGFAFGTPEMSRVVRLILNRL